jgi:hypothetical protein
MLLELAFDLIAAGEQPYFFAHHLIHEMAELGRSDLYQTLFAGVLDDQTFCYATICTDKVPRKGQNPETWQLRTKTLRRHLRRFNLTMHTLASAPQPTSVGPRKSLTTLILR